MPQSDRQPKTGKTSREQQTAAQRTGLNILRYALDHPSSTRRDIAHGLHLSFPNVCRLVAGFQEQGILLEEHSKQTGKRGPRSKTLSLRANIGCTIGVDLESTHVRAIILDFSNEIRGVLRTPIMADANGDAVVSMVAEAARAMVSSAREQGLQVFDVGLALPGPVIDEARGRVRTELQGGPAEMEFVPAVQEACDIVTFAAANDICFALGHHRMHHSRDSKMDLLVLNRFGLSAAVVRNGELYSGHLGLLPYGSETPVRYYRDVCTGGSILRLARSRNDHRQFQELISSPDDPLVKQWLDSAIPAFAWAIYSAAMMYSPDRLIIEGIFNKLPREVRAGTLDVVEGQMERLEIAPPEVSFFEGDDLMGARGAAFVARDHISDDVITGIVRAGRDARTP
jgi:predicted NBD/HSP70 family sugar kinase